MAPLELQGFHGAGCPRKGEQSIGDPRQVWGVVELGRWQLGPNIARNVVLEDALAESDDDALAARDDGRTCVIDGWDVLALAPAIALGVVAPPGLWLTPPIGALNAAASKARPRMKSKPSPTAKR